MSNSTKVDLPGGTVHADVPEDFAKILLKDGKARATWMSTTPLARNEWICLVSTGKSQETTDRRLERARAQLAEGQRRPCCWAGCMHRTDKALSPTQKWVLDRSTGKAA